MPDDTKQDQDPGSKDGIDKTAKSDSADKEEKFTKAQVTDMITKEVGKALKKKDVELEKLQTELQGFKDKDLGEVDKLQKKIEKLTKDLGEKDTELTGKNLRLAKMEALLNAGATSAQIPKLLKRVSGTTPEEIESDVKELTELGWIGKAPEPDPSKPAANGSGKPPVKDGIKKFTEAQLRAMKPEEYEANRADILKAMEGGLIQK